jgi:hypothetical protein
MPLPFAWLLAFALGAAFARAAQGELARVEGPLITSRPIAIVLAFGVLVVAPVAGYFAAFHGDWSYLYWVNWQEVPSAVDHVLVALAAALVPAGFVAAVPAIRGKRGRALASLVAVPLGVALILALVSARRLSVSASHAQYAGGFGVEPLGASVLGKGVLLAWVVLAAATAWTVRELRSA